MKYLKVLSLILMINLAVAQQPVRELFVKWDTESSEGVGFKTYPDGRFGPQSFKIQDSLIIILDPVNNSIKKYRSGKEVDHVYAPGFAGDFVIQEENKSFLVGNEIHRYSAKNLVNKYPNPDKFTSIEELFHKNDITMLRNSNGSVKKLGDNKILPLSKKTKTEIKDVQINLLSKNRVSISIMNGGSENILNLHHKENNLASVRFVGEDKNHRLYFDVDLIIKEVPLQVDREVWITNYSGDKLGTIHIPPHYFTKIHNDLEFDQSGILYHMLSSEDGIYIFKWIIPDSIGTDFDGYYRKKFQRNLHFDNFEGQSESRLEKKTEIQVSSVSRARSLEIGDSYVQHEWYCTADNITNGDETAPDGDIVDTPNWIQLGTNYKIPYKWGGFNTLLEYDIGMENGMYAGDTHTSGVSSYARGVDCSGYVSRCWEMSWHHSTSMMGSSDDVLEYSSWDELKPADAILKPGSHVILFVKHNNNGSLSCVEAAASTTNWKVDYTTHYSHNFSGYSPVYYVNMEDILPTPQNICVKNTNDSTIIIECEPVSGADTYVVYYGSNGSDYPDSALSENNVIEISGLNSMTAYYFKMKVYNDEMSSVFSNESYAAIPSENTNNVLIVNGFDRSTNTSHDYVEKYIEPLLEAGQGFSYVLNESVYEGNVSLCHYNTVIWILGDESSVDDTFNSIEQDSVKNFLRKGGNLFVSGPEIGWDLEGKSGHPTQADINFYHNFLKAEYVDDAPNDNQGQYYTAEQISGELFEGIADITFDNGSHGTFDVDWPDAINAINGANKCLKYKGVSSSNGVAGIYYEGIFPQGSAPGKLVYLTFPFETVYPQSSRTAIMEKVFDLFHDETGISNQLSTIHPEKYSLCQNYPNPFNPVTNIAYQIPENSFVNLSIYDITGRLVENLVDQEKVSGAYTAIWNASNYSSGMYLYSIKVYNSQKSNLYFTESEKCILMK